MYTPVNASFTIYQVGFKGTKSYRYDFVMGGKKILKAFSLKKVYPFSLNTCASTDFPRIKAPLQHYGVVNALTKNCLFVVAIAVVDVLLFCLYCNVTMILIFIIIIITILTIIRFVVIIIIIITIIYRFCLLLLLLLLFIYLFFFFLLLLLLLLLLLMIICLLLVLV